MSTGLTRSMGLGRSTKRRSLYRYQRDAYEFLLKNGGGALFAGVGTGKTAVMLHVAWWFLSTRMAQSALVVAPIAIVKGVWEQEAALWPELRMAKFIQVSGNPKQRLKALQTPADFYLLNYENLTWFLNLGLEMPDILILDESTKIKNAGSLRFRGRGRRLPNPVQKARPAVAGLKGMAKHFKYRFIMTGTPKPGEYENLWSQIYVLDLGKRLFENITTFRQEHYYQFGPMHYQRKLKRGHDKIIRNNIKDICYYISEDQIDHDLPKVVKRDYFIDLPANVRAKYDELEADMLIDFGDGEVVQSDSLGVMLNQLHQIGQGAIYLGDRNVKQLHDEKIDRLDALVEDLGDRRALVTYVFKHDLARLQAWRKAPVLSSKLPSAEFNDLLVAWNAGEIPILYGYPGTMGHGLNLQHGGCDVIMFGLTWGLERYQQTVGRLRRTGQESKRVFVHRIVARDTVEHDLILPRLRKASESQREFLAALRRYWRQVALRNTRLA